MKIREMLDRLDEISRRDFLKGAGATAGAAALGAPKDSSAERRWEQDPISQAHRATMNADNFYGAYLVFEGEDKSMRVTLLEPTNFSMKNVEAKRLHYPRITSDNYTLKIGNAQPVQGKGRLFSFPRRQLGDYTGHGIMLVQGAPKYFDSIYQSFIDAEQIFVRLEIDQQPTTLTFTAESENRARAERVRTEKIKAKLTSEMQNQNFMSAIIRGCILSSIGEPTSTKALNGLIAMVGTSHPINQEIQGYLKLAKNDPKYNTLTPDRLNQELVREWVRNLENAINSLNQVQEEVDEVASPDSVARIQDLIKYK